MLPVTGLLMDVGAHIYNSMKNFWGIYTTLTCYMKPLPNQKYQKSIIKCLHYDWFRRFYHCAKSVRIRKFSGPYFPALGLNTEYLSVFIPNAGKYGPNTGKFHLVRVCKINWEMGRGVFRTQSNIHVGVILRK